MLFVFGVVAVRFPPAPAVTFVFLAIVVGYCVVGQLWLGGARVVSCWREILDLGGVKKSNQIH
ncbi:hypothetical protein D3C80_1782880 [compost metagenome]